jgi:peroxiredoxin
MVGRLADAHADVTFVGVAALDQLPAMQKFVDEYPVKGFSHLADTDGAVWAKFGITQQPAYAFVSADGNIDVVRGSIPEAALTERVTALANQ